jgi:hypothetical protein
VGWRLRSEQTESKDVMKSFLALAVLSCAGLYGAGKLVERVNHISAAPEHPEAFALGIEAITGQLTERRLRELETTLTRVQPSEPQGVSRYPSDGIVAPSAIPEPPVSLPAVSPDRPKILEAWADDRGRVFARLSDGSTVLVLPSGERVIQPFEGFTAQEP